MSVVIGFGYKARQGKDQAVQAIVDARNGQYDVRRYSFAGALKREVNEAAEKAGGMLGLYGSLDFPTWVRYDANADMTDPECPLGKQRDLLQWWGTDFRRKQNPNYWVRLMDSQIKKENPQFALISDMRFFNEAYWVKACHGCTVKVVRHGWSDLSINSTHVSEKELDNYSFDVVLTVMDGALDELRREAVQIFDMVLNAVNPQFNQEDFLLGTLEKAIA